MSKKLYIAMYHYTRDLMNSRFPKIRGLDLELFKNQLDFFIANFNIVTMEQVIEAWSANNSELPDNALLLTFDDGYIDNYTVALPLLKERRIQGSFFIPGKTINENVLLDVNKIHFILATAPNEKHLMHDVINELDRLRADGYDIPENEWLIDHYLKPSRFDNAETIFVKRVLQTAIEEKYRNLITTNLFQKYIGIAENVFARELYMNFDQVKLMKYEGMFIGLHGYDHYWLGNLSDSLMRADIDKCIDVMGTYIDSNGWVLNYPYGNYSDSVLSYIESKGCKLGMTTEVRIAEIGKDNRFLLPRLDCNDFPPKSNRYVMS